MIRTAATANQLRETLQQYAEFLLDNKERPKPKSVLSFTKKTTGPDLLVPLKTTRVSTRGRFNPNYSAHGPSSQDQADIQFQQKEGQ